VTTLGKEQAPSFATEIANRENPHQNLQNNRDPTSKGQPQETTEPMRAQMISRTGISFPGKGALHHSK
jgi:hypothetical protein